MEALMLHWLPVSEAVQQALNTPLTGNFQSSIQSRESVVCLRSIILNAIILYRLYRSVA